MEYCKIIIDLTQWHLKPYYVERKVQELRIKERGFLCFKLIFIYNEVR